MTTLQAYPTLSSSTSCSNPRRIRASLQRPPHPPLPKPTQSKNMIINVERDEPAMSIAIETDTKRSIRDEKSVAKLYAIAEAAADRANMHTIVAEQRNSWNHLLLHSINSLTLTASITAGISSIPAVIQSSPHLHIAFKLSSALLFATSTAVMMIVNKIQPSQLAEEQRNAARLFRQLEKSIHTSLALGTYTQMHLQDSAMERVLALDKAYPLPLLPGMLDKFPKIVEPAVWWPTTKPSRRMRPKQRNNGWSKGLEKEMKGIVEVVKRRDVEQYVSFGKLVLRVNKILSFLGPMLAVIAAVGASLVGIGGFGLWAAAVGVVAGSMAAVVNTLQHGGQVGMVFELSRNCAGFYKELEGEIEGNLGEGDVGKREDGQLFEMKVALRLGRSVAELKGFRGDEEGIGKFAGKLF